MEAIDLVPIHQIEVQVHGGVTLEPELGFELADLLLDLLAFLD
jgi:hypothetical protein